MAEPSNAYGPVENSDDTRQAQQSVSNDAPTDVNFNAILARAQGVSLEVFGTNAKSNADRRDKMADANADRREKMADHAVGIFKVQ